MCCPGRGSEPGPGKDALSLTSPSLGMRVLWWEKAGSGGSPEAGGGVNRSLGLAFLQLQGPLRPGLLSTCSPAAGAALISCRISRASRVCCPSEPNISRVHLLAVYFLFVLGVTQSPFFTLMTSFFIIIVSTILFICFPLAPTTFPLFSQIGRGAHASLPCAPPSPGSQPGHLPWHPRAPLFLLGTSLKPDVTSFFSTSSFP